MSASKSTLLQNLVIGADSSDTSILPLVDRILQEAQVHRASDIHLEPIEGQYRLRFRIDGRFVIVAYYPHDTGARLISRLKVLSRLQVYKVSTPQEGRIHLDIGDGLDVRTSFFPTINGEKAVIRIFSFDSEELSLESLGFDTPLQDSLRALLSTHQGNIIVVGPAGVGKTTTLYCLLREIYKRYGEERSLATIEDPVENNLGYLPQTEINNAVGMTFAAALRSLLRQDPEVIMVGEIRDAETARISIQAGLTGHMVLSSIHANRAFSSFYRLMDLECDLSLILASLRGMLSQRLIRRLCSTCKRPASLPEELLVPYGLEGAQLYQAEGCRLCLGTGYSGRIAVGELLVMSRELKDHMRHAPQPEELEEIAVGLGFKPFSQGAVDLLRHGESSWEEVVPFLMEVGT